MFVQVISSSDHLWYQTQCDTEKMGVEDWIWKHYTKGNLNSAKCNHCGDVFSNFNQMQNLIYHLCDEHNIIELDEHSERDIIQQNYKISREQLMAICNHCKKRINLVIYGVHILTIHLKVLHPDECGLNTEVVKKKQVNIWDQYDIEDSIATCKKCKKTLRVNITSTSNLWDHLTFDCLLNQPRRISQVWDKFDIKDVDATCKECKETIKINPMHTVLNLKKHLLLYCTTYNYCRYVDVNHPDKDKLWKIGKSPVWDKYDITNNNATCKACKKIIKFYIKFPTSNLKQHLLYCRSIIINSKSDADLSEALMKTKEEPKILNFEKIEQTGVVDENTPSTSRSTADDTIQFQRQEQIKQSKKKKQKKRKFNYESTSTSESENEYYDEDFCWDKLKIEAKEYHLRKRRISIVDENAPSTSRSMEEEEDDAV